MSTTSTAPAPPAAQPAPAAGGSSLDAVRAFGVMLGGPIVLLATLAAAAAHTARSLRARRRPPATALAILAAGAAYRRWALPWMRRWGATDAEVARVLPGEGEQPASVQQTNAIAIDAPAREVWPWVAQIGQDRAGFYSYAWLEDLAGCRMPRADRIHPEWQWRGQGETVLLHPASGLKVERFEPGRALVLEGGWSLLVEPDGADRSRLLARFRMPRGPMGTAYALLLELPHFLMQRKMLLEIKRRAEAARP